MFTKKFSRDALGHTCSFLTLFELHNLSCVAQQTTFVAKRLIYQRVATEYGCLKGIDPKKYVNSLFSIIDVLIKNKLIPKEFIFEKQGKNLINIKSKKILNSALLFYVFNNTKENIQLLIHLGADIHALHKNGSTALILACKRKTECLEIVELLLEYGINIDHQDKDKDSALHWAIFKRHKNIVRLLLEKGANIHMRGWENKTALMESAKVNDKEIFALLLEQGATASLKDLSLMSHFLLSENIQLKFSL